MPIFVSANTHSQMLRALTAMIFLCFFYITVVGQPIIGHYLGETKEHNRGKKFQSIEEIHEVLIKDVAASPYKVIKMFNPNGLKISEITYGKEGGVNSKTSWEYSSDNRLLKKSHKYFVNIIGWREEILQIDYNPDTGAPESIIQEREGKTLQKATIILDTLGRVEMVQVFNTSGSLSFIEKLIYLIPANMIRVIVHRPNNQFIGTWSYPLDPNKEFSISSVNQFFYPNGDVRIETLTDASKGDQAYYYEYEYDSQGNWITKETYQVKLGKDNKLTKKKLEHRITRKITYH